VIRENWLDVQSPIGLIRIFEYNNRITAIDLSAKKISKKPETPSPALKDAADQITKYFEGKLTKFTIPVALENGTEFQQAVWKQIAKIGFGKHVSYADIAKAIGKPKASRAVGGAVGSNPIPLVVGCHRVLGASGKITGYSGGKGIPTKEWLLKHEGIESKA